ncbi:MAG: hypothetical protein ACRDJN_23955, partial [Chloroflexota bacterium]
MPILSLTPMTSIADDARRLRDQVREASRLLRLAVRLAWDASHRLLLGILLLVLLEATLPLAQLALAKVVIDRILQPVPPVPPAGDAGGIVWALPLGGWIALAVLVMGASQLIQPFSLAFQAMAGDRLTGYVTGRLIRAANSWRGLARFEDPAFADDLH